VPAAPQSNTNCFKASRRDWEMGSLIDSSYAARRRASWVGGKKRVIDFYFFA
jgi:hypothetical protein